MINNKVIVFGGNHHNTLGVIRGLGEKNIKSYVVIVNKNIKNSFVLKSKYVEKGWIFDTHNQSIDFLVKKFSKENIKPIIICTSDASSSSIDMNYDTLIQYFLIPNGGKKAQLTSLMDKEIMTKLAIKIGLTVANSWIIKKGIIDKDIKYPCITKPIKSITGSKDDIKICRNETELNNFTQSLKENVSFQVQEYINKDFEYQLIGCSLNGGETIIIPGFTEIIRSTSTTNTGFLKYRSIEELCYEKQKCINFIKECNYSGLFSLEFIRGKDGKDYFLEINFRNDGNAYSVTASGVNLPYIWVSSNAGIDFSDELSKKIKTIVIMPELVDIFHVIKRNISLVQWIKDVKSTDSFLYYDKNDMQPFYYQIKSISLNIVAKLPKVIQNFFK
jgi:predicted ATP-grasp superfamily ATP-dependent carboligase